MPETPSDALRAIADHLDRHPHHGTVSVFLAGVGLIAGTANLNAVIDGATAAEIEIQSPELNWPTVERDFGLAVLRTSVPREMLTERRPTVVEQVISTTELIARHAQTALAVEG